MVDRQSVPTHDPADPATESEAGHAGMGHDSGRYREAERLGFLVEVSEQRARLQEQIAAASSLEHPNAAHVLSLGQEGQTWFVVEEYMVGATPPPSANFADYLSVESVVVEGAINHLAVTGRMYQVEPFRETGLIIPSDFDQSVCDAVLDADAS